MSINDVVESALICQINLLHKCNYRHTSSLSDRENLQTLDVSYGSEQSDKCRPIDLRLNTLTNVSLTVKSPAESI